MPDFPELSNEPLTSLGFRHRPSLNDLNRSLSRNAAVSVILTCPLTLIHGEESGSHFIT